MTVIRPSSQPLGADGDQTMRDDGDQTLVAADGNQTMRDEGLITVIPDDGDNTHMMSRANRKPAYISTEKLPPPRSDRANGKIAQS